MTSLSLKMDEAGSDSFQSEILELEQFFWERYQSSEIHPFPEYQ